jgi:hypothetical protein
LRYRHTNNPIHEYSDRLSTKYHDLESSIDWYYFIFTVFTHELCLPGTGELRSTIYLIFNNLSTASTRSSKYRRQNCNFDVEVYICNFRDLLICNVCSQRFYLRLLREYSYRYSKLNTRILVLTLWVPVPVLLVRNLWKMKPTYLKKRKILHEWSGWLISLNSTAGL